MSLGDRLTPQDVQRAGYCLAGCKKWFEAQNLDFRDFLRSGIAVEDLPVDDAIVQHILKVRDRG